MLLCDASPSEAQHSFEKWHLRKIRADRVVLSPSPGLRSALPGCPCPLPLLGGGTKVPQKLTLGYDFMPVIFEGLEDIVKGARGQDGDREETEQRDAFRWSPSFNLSPEGTLGCVHYPSWRSAPIPGSPQLWTISGSCELWHFLASLLCTREQRRFA